MVIRTWLALLVGCVWLAGCSTEQMVPNTELILVADTDISNLERIEFEVSGEGSRKSAGGPVRADGAPLSLAVVRDTGPLGPITVSARGFFGDTLRVERRAVVSFVPNKTVVVPLHLLDGCIGAVCDERDTCTERGCESPSLGADDLSTWTGVAPDLSSTSDAGAELDAGGRDAALVADAAVASDAAVDAALWDECRDAGLVDLNSNVNHCGKCGKACSGPLYSWLNIMWVCKAAKCTYGCTALYGNCDDDSYNGCERSLVNDSSACGSCTTKCASTEQCNAQGSCVP